MADQPSKKELEDRIAQLEAQIKEFEVLSEEVAGFSAGNCTNDCTAACTIGCTRGCTGNCWTDTSYPGAEEE